MFTSDQRKVLPYAIVVLLGYIGFALPLPLFPEMFLDPQRSMLPADMTIGHKTFLLGLLLACYPFGQLIGSPILGNLSDRMGRKKTILVSLFIYFLSYLFIAYAIFTHFLVGIYIGLFIAGFAEGNVAIAQSVVADISPKEHKAKHFGFVEIFGTVGFIVGPLMGGILADPKKVSWFSFSTPFLFAALLTLVGFAIVLLNCFETRVKSQNAHSSFWASLTYLFSFGKLRTYYFANFFIALGFYSFFRFLPVYLERNFHFTSSGLAYVMAYDALWIGVALTFIIPRLSLLPEKATAIAAFLYALFLIILLIPQSPWFFALTIPPLGFCFAFSLTYGALLISDATDYAVHGQAMGCLISVQVLAATLMALFGGILAMHYPALPLMVGALMSILGGLFLSGQLIKRR